LPVVDSDSVHINLTKHFTVKYSIHTPIYKPLQILFSARLRANIVILIAM